MLWLFVYVLIEVIWNWGLSVDTSVNLSARSSCDAFGAVNLSPSPDHWLLHRPMDVSPPRAEFGWSATPLPQALGEYMQYLRAAH